MPLNRELASARTATEGHRAAAALRQAPHEAAKCCLCPSACSIVKKFVLARRSQEVIQVKPSHTFPRPYFRGPWAPARSAKRCTMLKKKTAAKKAAENAAQSAAARLAEQLDGNRAGPSDGGVSEVPDEQKTTEELVYKAQAVHGDTTRTAQNALRVRWGFRAMHGSCSTTILSQTP